MRQSIVPPQEPTSSVERPHDPILSRVIWTWLHSELTLQHTKDSCLVLPSDGRGIWIMANHLSFLDAHVVDWALREHADPSMALWACAGPKVHDGHRGAFADSLNIIQVPQPAGISGTKDLRALAAAARASIGAAQSKVAAGQAVLVFPEGTRSRTGTMGEWNKGVARYVSKGDWIIPMAIRGTEVLGGCIGGAEQTPLVDARGGKKVDVSVTCCPPIEVQDPLTALMAARQVVQGSLGEA